MTALANFPLHLCRRASMYRDAKLRGLLLTLLCIAAGVFVACNGGETGTGPTAQPTVDILSTVDGPHRGHFIRNPGSNLHAAAHDPAPVESRPPRVSHAISDLHTLPDPYSISDLHPATHDPARVESRSPCVPYANTLPDLHTLPDPYPISDLHPVSFPYCHEGTADIHAGASPTDSRIVPIADSGAPSPIP